MTKENIVQGIEDRQPRRSFWQRYRDIFISIGWIVAMFALQIVTGTIALIWHVMTNPSPLPWTARAADMTAMAIPMLWSLIAANLLLLLLVNFYLRRKGRYSLLGLDRWSSLPAGKTILLGIAVTLVGIGFNYLYTAYILPDVKMQEDIHRILNAVPRTPLNMVFILAAAAILPAIVEEVLFRGLLQGSLKPHVGPYAAILIAAFVFALMHGDMTAAPALFVLGLSFGFLYETTGSLRVNIAMHMLNNTAALLLAQ